MEMADASGIIGHLLSSLDLDCFAIFAFSAPLR